MFAFLESRLVLIGALGGMFAASQIASAAGPLESTENSNERGDQNPLIGAQERPKFQGQTTQQPGVQQPGVTQPSVGLQRMTANKVVAMAPEALADREIAQWLLASANEEVQIAKLAENHASNQQVRDFAHQMQQAHTKQWRQLEQFAVAEGTGKAFASPEALPAQPALEGSRGGGLDFVELHRQIVAECISTANRELGAKQGADFDKAYIGSQIGAHYRMIDTCKVLRNYASPQLRKLVDDGLLIAQHHVDEAHTIMHSLEKR